MYGKICSTSKNIQLNYHSSKDLEQRILFLFPNYLITLKIFMIILIIIIHTFRIILLIQIYTA